MITYAITDRTLAPAGDLILQASGLIRAGIGWIQIREKDLSDRTLYAALRMLVPEARRFGAKLLLNGRPDLAAAAGASGVHLPSDGLPTERVRLMFPAPFLVLRSCHSETEVMDAAGAGADAVTLGPVFETPSKRAMGSPMGLERFGHICKRSPIPVLGLGGIEAARISSVMDAGAAGVAAIRLFCSLPNPQEELPRIVGALR